MASPRLRRTHPQVAFSIRFRQRSQPARRQRQRIQAWLDRAAVLRVLDPLGTHVFQKTIRRGLEDVIPGNSAEEQALRVELGTVIWTELAPLLRDPSQTT